MIRNVHTRVVERDPVWLARALERVAEPDGEIWPRDSWPPLVLDRPLAVGAIGGHGPIRYRVIAYEPGRRLVFEFDPEIGIEGTHAFELTPTGEPGKTMLRHELLAKTSGSMVLMWVFVIRWMHDAVIEDVFDRAEFAPEDLPPRGSTWSPWVRLLRRWRVRKSAPRR